MSETKIRRIKQVLKRCINGTCVKCGSEYKEIEDPNLKGEINAFSHSYKTFQCTKCGFIYCQNWQHEYILEIERILKIKENPNKLTLPKLKGYIEEQIESYKKLADSPNSVHQLGLASKINTYQHILTILNGGIILK